MAFTLLLFVIFNFFEQIYSEEIIVGIPNGQIKGFVDVTQYSNLTYYSFLEVPYGQPPTGELRFMSPQPVKNWEGVKDCTTNSHICHQTTYDSSSQTEDCLYVNIYTPVKPGTKKSLLPVIYYIYGGGFINGAHTESPSSTQFFMEQDVVIVSVSYRTGIFGFLSTEDEIVLGNFGLKDQNLALKWVQDNIEIFGGDPKKVTIFGQSAGAASVTYQILSKKSEGLFWGAIGESASALCPWAYQRHAKSIAYQVAALVDPNFTENNSSKELLDLLQNADVKAIDDAVKQVTWYGEELVQGFRFAPIIETDLPDAFITESMYNSVANGNINRVPLMIGICSEEEINRAGNLDSLKNNIHNYEQNIGSLVNEDFHLEDQNVIEEVGEKIRHIYTDGLLEDNLGSAVRYFSDVSFNKGVIRYAELQSKFTDVYFYQFSYHGSLGGNNIQIEGADRVTHSEDLNYLWVPSTEGVSEDDLLTVKRYTKLFTNFAKTLNPTPEPADIFQNLIVPKVNASNFQYLNINGTLEIKTNPKEAVYKKWVELYDTYAIKPLDTY